MKALTICQPYAALICLPDDDGRHKRIENRTWPTPYRGPLAIHAGKSRDWISWDAQEVRDEEYDLTLAQMEFGAVVAIAKLANCVRVGAIHEGKYDDIYPWAKSHQHAEGPWCWILQDVRPLAKPIPYRGAQGLFEIEDALLSAFHHSAELRHG